MSEFKKSEVIIPIRDRAKKAVQSVTLVDIAIVAALGLSIYTLSPWFIAAAVVVVGIKEGKDYLVKKDTENRVKKLEESTTMTLMAFDESVVALNAKVEKLNANELNLSKDMKKLSEDTSKALTDQKNEINRFITKQRDVLGV